MKSIIAKTFSLLVISTVLFSFSGKPGGEGFEVYLNNKLILQRFGNNMNTVQTIRLDEGSPNDELTINYHHCGKVGKNRVLTVKDGQDKVLKAIRFADANSPTKSMSCRAKEIISLKKGTTSTLKLYYASSELPGGRLLATIVSGKPVTASVLP